MNGSLLRGRLLVRIQSGSPNLPINTGHCDVDNKPLCKFIQDFAACVREHVKNTDTKPEQSDSACEESLRHYEQKNLGSAATETEINSLTKASSSFVVHIIESNPSYSGEVHS